MFRSIPVSLYACNLLLVIVQTHGQVHAAVLLLLNFVPFHGAAQCCRGLQFGLRDTCLVRGALGFVVMTWPYLCVCSLSVCLGTIGIEREGPLFIVTTLIFLPGVTGPLRLILLFERGVHAWFFL